MTPFKHSYLLPLLVTPSIVIAQDQELPPISSLDTLTVTANRSGQTLFEQIQPASVLSGEELLLKREATLGETLSREPGISATSFAPGASRPIIRGLSEDRVRILENGTSIIDVSNVSPDHAVSSDPLGFSAVEVVRGPATLLYGPNSIGGVVNIINERIPEEVFTDKYPTGHYGFSVGSADNSVSQGGSVKWGAGPLVFRLDAFKRDTENIDIPGFQRSSDLRATDPPGTDQPRDTLPNSFTSSEGAGFGASYIFDKGFIGFSYSGYNSNYGTVGEPDVTIDLKQRRFDLRGAIYEPADWIREVNFKFSHSNYDHTEFEGDETGTVFDIDGFNFRTELLHEKVNGFEGAIGYELQHTDFTALGEEAFLPPTESYTNSIFIFEEYEVNEKTRLQFGARYDHQTHDSDSNPNFGPGQDLEFDAFSASAGVIYNPVEDYAISLNVGYSQRPPTYVELLANGPHVATSIFEIGDPSLDTEDSISIDLSLRKKYGRVTGSVSAFYYHFNDFISLEPTGAIADDLPVFAYDGVGANFYGAEAEATFHLLAPLEEGGSLDPRLDLILRADYVHAENRSTDEPLPRIPPLRVGAALEYATGPWLARIDGDYSADQDRNADFETETDSYFLLSASLAYQVQLGSVESTFYIKGTNLTDEEARPSTSFLKDVSPLAGRGVVVGLNAEF